MYINEAKHLQANKCMHIQKYAINANVDLNPHHEQFCNKERFLCYCQLWLETCIKSKKEQDFKQRKKMFTGKMYKCIKKEHLGMIPALPENMQNQIHS